MANLFAAFGKGAADRLLLRRDQERAAQYEQMIHDRDQADELKNWKKQKDYEIDVEARKQTRLQDIARKQREKQRNEWRQIFIEREYDPDQATYLADLVKDGDPSVAYEVARNSVWDPRKKVFRNRAEYQRDSKISRTKDYIAATKGISDVEKRLRLHHARFGDITKTFEEEWLQLPSGGFVPRGEHLQLLIQKLKTAAATGQSEREIALDWYKAQYKPLQGEATMSADQFFSQDWPVLRQQVLGLDAAQSTPLVPGSPQYEAYHMGKALEALRKGVNPAEIKRIMRDKYHLDPDALYFDEIAAPYIARWQKLQQRTGTPKSKGSTTDLSDHYYLGGGSKTTGTPKSKGFTTALPDHYYSGGGSK